jgi:hypothetical protein
MKIDRSMIDFHGATGRAAVEMEALVVVAVAPIGQLRAAVGEGTSARGALVRVGVVALGRDRVACGEARAEKREPGAPAAARGGSEEARPMNPAP